MPSLHTAHALHVKCACLHSLALALLTLTGVGARLGPPAPHRRGHGERPAAGPLRGGDARPEAAVRRAAHRLARGGGLPAAAGGGGPRGVAPRLQLGARPSYEGADIRCLSIRLIIEGSNSAGGRHLRRPSRSLLSAGGGHVRLRAARRGRAVPDAERAGGGRGERVRSPSLCCIVPQEATLDFAPMNAARTADCCSSHAIWHCSTLTG